MAKVTEVVDVDPEVQKTEEYSVFLGLVARGLWKNNKFIADVVGVDDETIATWKLREEVKKIRQQSIGGDLERWKRSSDPEKRLKEQGMEFDPDKVEAKVEIIVKGLENL